MQTSDLMPHRLLTALAAGVLVGCAPTAARDVGLPDTLERCGGIGLVGMRDPAAFAGAYRLQLFPGRGREDGTVYGTLTLLAVRDLPSGDLARAQRGAGRGQLIGWVDPQGPRLGTFEFTVDPASRDLEAPGVVGLWSGGPYPLTLTIGGVGGHTRGLNLGVTHHGPTAIGGMWGTNPDGEFDGVWCATPLAGEPGLVRPARRSVVPRHIPTIATVS